MVRLKQFLIKYDFLCKSTGALKFFAIQQPHRHERNGTRDVIIQL